jgi:predicted DNA-binding protein (UPF0251 family)
VPVRGAHQASSPPVLLGRVQSLWLIPPISGVRTSSFASVGERSRETPIYQGNRCDPYNGVEVTTRYSNPPGRAFELRKLLTATPVRGSESHAEPSPRQRQRRLRPEELERLTAGYLAGIEVKVLAERFGIARQTVFDLMRRNKVPGRYPRLGPVEIDEARSQYLSGMSLADVGRHLGVDAGTVRQALIRIGVAMRNVHGRDRTN